MGANIKIKSDSSQFISEMKQVTNNLKLMDSSLSVATERAKLFGSTTDQLKAKHAQLGNSLKSNTTLLGLQNKTISTLTTDIAKYKDRNNELSKSIGEVESKLKEQIKLTGEDSKEVKELQGSLNKLQNEYKANDKAIDRANSNIDKYKLKMNEVEKAVLQDKKALEELDKKMSTEKLEKVSTATGKVGSALTKLSVPIVGAGVASSKFAMDFEDGMAKISTIVDETSKVSLKQLGQGVLDLSNMTGESFNTIQEGMYDTISSGVKAEDSINFLKVAVKSAKGGFTDTATAVDGLTSVINAYGLKTEEAANISNQMFIAQNLGKTTFGEMSQYLGNVIPISASLKVKTNELFSSLAVLTANGIKSGEAVTGLKSAMSNIIKPSDEAKKASEALGLKFDASAVASKGWMGFLQEVKNKLKEVAPEYAQAVDRVNSLTQAINSGKGSVSNHASEIQNLKNRIQELRSSSATITDYSDKISSLRAEISKLNSESKNTKNSDEKANYRNKIAAIREEIQNLQTLQKQSKSNAKSVKADNKEQIEAIEKQIKALQAQDKAMKGGSSNTKDLQKQLKEAKADMKGLEEGSNSQLSAFAQLFGSVEGLNSVLTLTSDQGVQLYNESMKQMQSSTTTTDDAFNKVNNTAGSKLRKSLNESKNAMIGFGDAMSPVISNVSSGLAGLTGWFNNLDQGQKNLVVGLGTFIVTSGLTLTAVSKVTGAVKDAHDSIGLLKDGVGFLGDKFGVVKGFISKGAGAIADFGLATGKALINVGKMTVDLGIQCGTWIAHKIAVGASTVASTLMTGAQWLLNVALDANPIGIVVMAIAGLVGAFVLAYNKVQWFHDGINAIGRKIKEFWDGLWNWEIPHIPLPHFDIKGKFSLTPPQTPYLDVQWYSSGGIFTQPTLLGNIGVGDANKGSGSNAEAVLPLNLLWTELEKNFKNLEERLNNNNSNVYVYVNVDNKMDRKSIASEVTKEIERTTKLRTV